MSEMLGNEDSRIWWWSTREHLRCSVDSSRLSMSHMPSHYTGTDAAASHRLPGSEIDTHLLLRRGWTLLPLDVSCLLEHIPVVGRATGLRDGLLLKVPPVEHPTDAQGRGEVRSFSATDQICLTVWWHA